MGHVQRQIHQDVNAIRTDHRCRLLIRKAYDAPPAVGVPLEFICHSIRAQYLCITGDLKLPPIVLAEQRNEVAHRRHGP